MVKNTVNFKCARFLFLAMNQTEFLHHESIEFIERIYFVRKKIKAYKNQRFQNKYEKKYKQYNKKEKNI